MLSGNAFKLYIYLLSNVNGYNFGFSPKDVADRYGCSIDTVRSAFTTLVDKCFLTFAEESKSKYIFKDTIVEQEVPKDTKLNTYTNVTSEIRGTFHFYQLGGKKNGSAYQYYRNCFAFFTLLPISIFHSLLVSAFRLITLLLLLRYCYLYNYLSKKIDPLLTCYNLF